jgi:uncharacterized membrane protein affecting hemolysin expression
MNEDKLSMMIWRSVVVTLVLCIAMLFIIFFVATEKPIGYDCQLAEISPDVPLAYKQACREAKRK